MDNPGRRWRGFRDGFPPIVMSLRNRNDQDPRCFAAFELRDANGVLPEQILEDTGWIVASRQVNHLRRPTSARRDLQEIRVRRDDGVPMFTRPIPDDAVVNLLQLDLANVQEAWKQGAQAKDELGRKIFI